MKALSDISADELRHAGYVDEAGVIDLKEPTEMMVTGAKKAEAVTILKRADPIAILILQPLSKTLLHSMFMATGGFFSAGNSEPTRFLRKYLDAKMEKRPLQAITSTTYSQHPLLLKWYRFMRYSEPTLEADGKGHTFVRPPGLKARRAPNKKPA
ncbi:hypothetical protein [Mesorhizobium sp. M0091]|uniref:hypothetical protein n=1 Tax=Mesorhizobium sp. M0091 TaxID=2956875 RepID=UPI003336DD29